MSFTYSTENRCRRHNEAHMTRVINQKMDIRFFQTFLPFLISLLCFSLWNATQAQPKGSDPLFLIKQHGK